MLAYELMSKQLIQCKEAERWPGDYLLFINTLQSVLLAAAINVCKTSAVILIRYLLTIHCSPVLLAFHVVPQPNF